MDVPPVNGTLPKCMPNPKCSHFCRSNSFATWTSDCIMYEGVHAMSHLATLRVWAVVSSRRSLCCPAARGTGRLD